MASKIKQYSIKCIDGAELFKGNDEAWNELNSSGTYGFGADKSLATRQGLLDAMQGLEAEGNTKNEIVVVIERIKEVPVNVYVDLSEMFD